MKLRMIGVAFLTIMLACAISPTTGCGGGGGGGDGLGKNHPYVGDWQILDPGYLTVYESGQIDGRIDDTDPSTHLAGSIDRDGKWDMIGKQNGSRVGHLWGHVAKNSGSGTYIAYKYVGDDTYYMMLDGHGSKAVPPLGKIKISDALDKSGQ